ncbi:MAG: L,D-transpeptidase [Gorillibacterium sp.]|nr:L,D-transpeptidase [Gorillibacterium sp.]
MPAARIIVDLADRQLYLLRRNIVERSFPVGIGRMVSETPRGEFHIINKQKNPGGPFGALWMGLSKPHYGIHGTNNPASIGHLVSNGCIRMYNDDVLALSKLAPVGTQVTIRS